MGTLAKVLTQGGYFKLGKGENTSQHSKRQSVVVSQCLPYPLPILRSRVFNHRVSKNKNKKIDPPEPAGMEGVLSQELGF